MNQCGMNGLLLYAWAVDISGPWSVTVFVFSLNQVVQDHGQLLYTSASCGNVGKVYS